MLQSEERGIAATAPQQIVMAAALDDFAALDPEMTAEVLDMIEQLRKQGTDLILVTHEMGFARIAADRVAFLSSGRILEFGQTKSVFEQPATEECRRFLGTVLKY